MRKRSPSRMTIFNSPFRSAFAATLLLIGASCASSDGDDSRRSSSEPARPLTVRSYDEPAGPNAVGSIPEGSVMDPKRQREISLSVDYPIKAGTYPLIVFSHGFGGSSRGYVGLSSYWASHGYVVVKPTHRDTGRGSSLREAADEMAKESEAEWRDRVRDITAVIDEVDALEEKYPELKGKIDRTRVGVGGHSYGAFTAMLLGGVTPMNGDVRLALGDARVKAIVAMSPQGPTERLRLTERSYSTLTLPTLFMTGTRDVGAAGEDAAWRRRPFELAPAGNKHFISIEGAHHFSFSGRFSDTTVQDARERDEQVVVQRDPFGRPVQMTQSRPRSAITFERESAIFATVKTTSLAFWDAQLKNEERGREYLERLRSRSGIEFVTR